ncbi:MAG: hypothetical protein JSS40_13270 [Proteobacteria bacterium]|nr:hypothetical protein [Pseudomonadota bacterium]
MSRVIILVAAVLVFFWLLRRALGSRKGDGSGPQAPKAGNAPAPDLVSCAQCGVHLPKNEAVAAGDGRPAGEFYCCEEHRRLGPR